MISLRYHTTKTKYCKFDELESGDTVIAHGTSGSGQDLAIWLVGSRSDSLSNGLYGTVIYSDKYPEAIGQNTRLSRTCEYEKVNIELVVETINKNE